MNNRSLIYNYSRISKMVNSRHILRINKEVNCLQTTGGESLAGPRVKV